MSTIEISNRAFLENYNYIWLKSMLKKAQETTTPGSTLITGSSYGLGGIYEAAWENAVNCSGESQDLYYDFQMIKAAVSQNHVFEKCIIILGYYAAFTDISLASNSREELIGRRYYPIFKDSHNWDHVSETDLFKGLYTVKDLGRALTPQERDTVEREIEDSLIQFYYDKGSTYYIKDIINRGTSYCVDGLLWPDFTEEIREKCAVDKTKTHLDLLKHKDSQAENTEILESMIDFLQRKQIIPLLIVPPFTKNYLRHIDPEFEKSLLQMIDSIPQEVMYVDFNKYPDIFEDADFLDPDHLNAKGGKKFSRILAMMFGR